MARSKDPSLDAYRLLQAARQKSAGSSYPVSTDVTRIGSARNPSTPPRTGGESAAHGPFAAPLSTASKHPSTPPGSRPTSAIAGVLEEGRRGPFTSPAQWHPLVWVLQIVALATAFGLGRLSVGWRVEAAANEAREAAVRLGAAPEEGREHEGERATSPGAERASAERRRPEDLAFTEARTRVSIVTISYAYPLAKDPEVAEYNQALAFESFRHLEALGFPVVSPRLKGDQLVLFVGAAERQAELEDLLAELRATSGPDGRGRPYASAFIANVDAYRKPSEVWSAELDPDPLQR